MCGYWRYIIQNIGLWLCHNCYKPLVCLVLNHISNSHLTVLSYPVCLLIWWQRTQQMNDHYVSNGTVCTWYGSWSTSLAFLHGWRMDARLINFGFLNSTLWNRMRNISFETKLLHPRREKFRERNWLCQGTRLQFFCLFVKIDLWYLSDIRKVNSNSATILESFVEGHGSCQQVGVIPVSEVNSTTACGLMLSIKLTQHVPYPPNEVWFFHAIVQCVSDVIKICLIF